MFFIHKFTGFSNFFLKKMVFLEAMFLIALMLNLSLVFAAVTVIKYT